MTKFTNGRLISDYLALRLWDKKVQWFYKVLTKIESRSLAPETSLCESYYDIFQILGKIGGHKKHRNLMRMISEQQKAIAEIKAAMIADEDFAEKFAAELLDEQTYKKVMSIFVP